MRRAAAMCSTLVDIGVNLTDHMYQGIYNGSRKHQEDLSMVIERAVNRGVRHMIITGGSLDESKKALKLAQSNPHLFSTVGCHPTRALEFEENEHEYLEQLTQLALGNKGKVVAVGEFGLDYDRLNFCPKNVQKKYFERQMQLAERTKLPLFLHCRAAGDDLSEILKRHRDTFNKGVVHSFTGTWDEADNFLNMGLYIGINGCSLKTPQNLDVVAKLPLEQIMLETDAPWCEIKSTHAGYKFIREHTLKCNKKEKFVPGEGVKGRNEPINMFHVLQVVAAVRDEDEETVAKTTTETALQFFDISSSQASPSSSSSSSSCPSSSLSLPSSSSS